MVRALPFVFAAAFLAFLLAGCIDRYLPEVTDAGRTHLVVDGFINSDGSTSIRLSRTGTVEAAAALPAEAGAVLYIEQEGGPRYALPETSVPGTYTSAQNLLLDNSRRHRLYIRTTDGQEYASAFVPITITPPIEEVAWGATDAGLTVYVSSRNETAGSRYYRWEYEETWEISPTLRPDVEYRNGQLRDIRAPYPLVCWDRAISTAILLGATTKLGQNVVVRQPVHSLPTTSSRLYRKYSILVKQHALSPEEYSYWELLKKNTESIGTLFDPLPSQLTGNVQCLSDPEEIVLGYVGAHSVQQKRIFIDNTELPRNWRSSSGYEKCSQADTVEVKLFPTMLLSGDYVPVMALYKEGSLVGATYSTPTCVDCRKRGTAVRPSFWQ